MAARSATRRRAIGLTLAAFVAAFIPLQVASYTSNAATFDEPIHLTSGYAALARGDYRVEGTHPPFMRMWAALPLVFMKDVHLDTTVIDRTAPAAWTSGATAFEFSTRFLYVDNDADRLLNAARFMIVICGLVLGVLVFSWAYEWLGLAPAVCSLVLYTLSPNLLAHTSLVTTDAGITCFVFGTIYFLWRTCRQISALNLAGLAMFFSLAIVTKFSALILGPVVVVLLGIAVAMRTAVTARVAAAIVVLLAATSFFAIWAVCGFRYLPSENPAWVLHLEGASLARTVPALATVTRWVDAHHLLPNAITEGFLIFTQSMLPPNYTFMAGAYSEKGWWYYFPFVFLIKTPIPLIVLVAIGAYVSARRRRELGGMNEAFIFVPMALYAAAAMNTTFQVGLRHILPLYPFLILTAGAGATALVRRSAGRVALGALAIASSVALASVYPFPLTYFNSFVGGPSNGYRYLTDSNVDWGQGLKELKKWMDERGVSHVGLAYYGTADPAYYGIGYALLPAAASFQPPSGALQPLTRPRLPGYVAVGATVLTGVYHEPHWQLFYRGLRDRTPEAVIGNSLFVYWLDEWPEADESVAAATSSDVETHRQLGDELMKLEWFDHAIVHYRRSIGQSPPDPATLTNLGLALILTGKPMEAIGVLRHAVQMAPASGPAQLALASAFFDARLDISEVVTQARRAAALLPSDPDALVMLGRALAVSGQLDEAGQIVHRAVTLAPAHSDARELLQRILAVTGERRG